MDGENSVAQIIATNFGSFVHLKGRELPWMQSAIATLRWETAIGLGLWANILVWTFRVWTFESFDEIVLVITKMLETGLPQHGYLHQCWWAQHMRAWISDPLPFCLKWGYQLSVIGRWHFWQPASPDQIEHIKAVSPVVNKQQKKELTDSAFLACLVITLLF